MCVHPEDGGENSPPGTYINTWEGCNGSRLRFCYVRSSSTAEEGDIKHESGHCLVPARKTDATWNKMDIVLGPCGVSYSRWRFNEHGNVQHVSSGLCWHPEHGHAVRGGKVILYNGCRKEQRLSFWI